MPRVAKKFKRISSIPIHICLSINYEIQIHENTKLWQDLNPNPCSSLVISIHCGCEIQGSAFLATRWG